ncbi:sigma-70 family RNA polymerase sigma factor [Streptomyces piniterrae]|uniref:Sigma-70 family RNA polymerase sigma factor n=1 Tax=Streptomyces piniterrae TaxID=2571125 RepID=A0A4U0NRF5_9ACTN|nr:sigma-70 family RNA polymerase sigma factor [Streptomyces piniterrae]TJZ57169.1 sigma-70 family RNA polymerase sigma factor [Streptomyces piniterrae]
MAANNHPAHSRGSYGGSEERWQRMWSHREQLLKVARRRSMSLEDAEDAVHEAMLRAVENPHVDEERLGAWLTTVTMRLCADRYRQVNREAQVGSRSTFAVPPPPAVEEEVCDRAEAKWLASRSGELPARQAEALWLKSEDLDVGQVARKMGLSYRTVESLLARARRTLRNSLAATLGAALWLVSQGRQRAGGGGAQAATLVSTAATLAVLGFAAPHYPYAPDEARPGPVSPEEAEEWPTASYDSDAPSSSWGATSAPGRAGGELGIDLTAEVPAMLPEAVMLPGLAVPSVPAVPPALRIPSVPTVPSVPSVSSRPGIPDVPGASSAGDVPSAPSADSARSQISNMSDLSGPSASGSPSSVVPSAGLGGSATEPLADPLPTGSLHTDVQP